MSEQSHDTLVQLRTIIQAATNMIQTHSGERYVVTSIPGKEDVHLVMLSDVLYWYDHYDELESWAKENGGDNITVRGMVVSIRGDELLTLFLLRWS